jgi:PDZ domain-containing protein
MPELTLPRTTPEVPLDLREWEPPGSNGHGPPPGGNGDGPGGGGRPGGGRPGGGPGGAGDMDRTDWRWLHRVLAAGALFLLACLVANLIPLDKYVLTSGEATAAANLIHVVTGDHGGRRDGKVLLTGAGITQVSAFGYLYFGIFGHAKVVAGTTVLGPGIPPSEFSAEQDAESALLVPDAEAAAFRNLGYSVGGREAGVLVLAVEPGSPGSAQVRQGQIVTAVDGVAAIDACAFSREMGHTRPGQLVRLTVEQSRVTTKATLVAGSKVVEQVRLGRWPASIPESAVVPGCPRSARTRSGGYLGLFVASREVFRFPVPVSVHASGLEGLSGGLAIALGIVDLLSGGHLAGDRTVAAAGTLTPNGHVGEVDGIADAGFAAWRAGATVFVVPSRQAAVARSAVPSSVRVIGVRSLTQAIDEVRSLGAKVRRPSGGDVPTP